MVGQVATLRDRVTTVSEIHREVSVKASERISTLGETQTPDVGTKEDETTDAALFRHQRYEQVCPDALLVNQ